MSLLKQLAQDHTAVYDIVKSLYRNHELRGTRPIFQEFQEIFQLAIKTFFKVFIVVDALDECSGSTREELPRALRSLADNISLLVTSRYLSSIKQEFEGVKHLDIRASDQDVRKYIESQIPLLPFLKIHVAKEAALLKEIVEALIGKMDGMSVTHLRS
jgi:hypothetical protein